MSAKCPAHRVRILYKTRRSWRFQKCLAGTGLCSLKFTIKRFCPESYFKGSSTNNQVYLVRTVSLLHSPQGRLRNLHDPCVLRKPSRHGNYIANLLPMGAAILEAFPASLNITWGAAAQQLWLFFPSGACVLQISTSRVFSRFRIGLGAWLLRKCGEMCLLK